jgi:prolyl 4-hydroxylase
MHMFSKIALNKGDLFVVLVRKSLLLLTPQSGHPIHHTRVASPRQSKMRTSCKSVSYCFEGSLLHFNRMKFVTPRALVPQFRLARMGKEGNEPLVAMKKTTQWNLKQFIAITLFGALIATLIPFHYSSLTPSFLKMITSSNTQITTNPDPPSLSTSNIRILSFDPFIAHISNFISPSEITHLLELGYVTRHPLHFPLTNLLLPFSNPLLTSSSITDASGSSTTSAGRTSSTAFLPPTDPTVASIASRAAAFQGFLNPADVDVQITSYTPGAQYKHHYDWFPPPRSSNRISTFFAILESTCAHCGTEFPFLNTSARATYAGAWCAHIDCSAPALTSLNVPGSAVFWVNLDARLDGRVDMLHAGLPALGGSKVGLNVWTEMAMEEVQGRALFGGHVREWERPTRQFLERYELVPPRE